MSGDSSKSKGSNKGFNAGDRLPFEPKKSGKAKKAKDMSKPQPAESSNAEPKKPVPRKLNPITTFKNKDKADSNKGGKNGDRDKPRGKVYTREEMAKGIDVCQDCHSAIHRFVPSEKDCR